MAKINFTCSFCNSFFERYENLKRKPKHNFCSLICRNEAFKTNMKGENNPNYKFRDLNKICKCGNNKDIRSEFCSKCSKKSFPVNEKESFRIEKKELIKSNIKNFNSVLSLSKFINVNRGTTHQLLIEIYGKIPGHFRAGRIRVQDDEHYFCISPYRRNSTIKNKLLKNNKIKYECCLCKQNSVWNNISLTLELDHINGNPCDNRIENLRFLCPNCHSQQSTSRGRNEKSKIKKKRMKHE